ncbi:hypothetical protein FRC09_019215 [Ceratobasidium sp. 395]|nr:hypothetical protein FRC09_019215 [Ceratobasidium sp. 395]
MASTAGLSSAPSHGQKRRRNPDPYGLDLGDGEYLGNEALQEAKEVNRKLDDLLNNSSERIYKSILRMGPPAFANLLELIKEDHVFFGVPQPPLKYQLAVYLATHGEEGMPLRQGSRNETSTASLYGLTQSTVSRWCACVGYALMRLPDHFLDDLEPVEKRAIKKVVKLAQGGGASAGPTGAKKARR